MTYKQLMLLLELIDYKIAKATHPQTPPSSYQDEIDRLVADLIGECDD